MEIAVLGEHSYTVRFSMAGIFLPLFLWSTSLKIFEVALSFCATDGSYSAINKNMSFEN